MPSYLAFALLTPLLGFSLLTMLNAANTTVQLSTEPAMRGRVMALYMTVIMGGTPIGSPVVGWVGADLRRALDAHRGRLMSLLGSGSRARLRGRATGRGSPSAARSGRRARRPPTSSAA